jgi:ABC-type oligopeptide transport system ATPase subunit
LAIHSAVGHLVRHATVMFNGAIVEQGGADHVYADPRDPYTQRLLVS